MCDLVRRTRYRTRRRLLLSMPAPREDWQSLFLAKATDQSLREIVRQCRQFGSAAEGRIARGEAVDRHRRRSGARREQRMDQNNGAEPLPRSVRTRTQCKSSLVSWATSRLNL